MKSKLMSSDNFPDEDKLLEPDNMLTLYSRGAFPMADESGNLEWYLPEIRTIIPLENFNIPKSLKKFIKIADFEYRYDTSFLDVINCCASRSSTWISDKLIEAYKRLIDIGHLHTVEVWQNNNLIGGLYGVTYKGAFFGESMFSKISQASKAALVKLIEKLNRQKFILLDVQFMTPHLKMFGAVEINFEDFTKLLYKAYRSECNFN
jgi:leucyl/phenylalanyl-tRNA---protein transferase